MEGTQTQAAPGVTNERAMGSGGSLSLHLTPWTKSYTETIINTPYV